MMNQISIQTGMETLHLQVTPDERLDLSVLIPMYNEEQNVVPTVAAVRQALENTDYAWELVLVDDGSQDSTLALAREQAMQDSRVRVFSYPENGGQGKAMKRGFRQVWGDIVITIDADLSYDPKCIPQLVDELVARPDVDIVIGSPYMRGGGVQNVPRWRLLLSRAANRLIGLALDGRLSTTTGILRAYRREVLDGLVLESNGPEINLEALSKALALGHVVHEIPAVLKGRERGSSKIRVPRQTIDYMMFSFFERPILVFGVLGIVLLLAGIGVTICLLFDFWRGSLNPERPLMTVMILLILVGLQFLSFGFLGTQLVRLRKDLYRFAKQSRRD